METSMVEQVEQILHDANLTPQDNSVKEFEEAIEEFDLMIAQKLTSRRGNNLLSIDQSHLHRICFNSKSD